MATGAKIGIVLGLLLLVICFVRILDQDISDGVGQTDNSSSSASSGSGDDSDSGGFSSLGDDEGGNPAKNVSDLPGDDEASDTDNGSIGDSNSSVVSGDQSTDSTKVLDPSDGRLGASGVRAAGLRNVRNEDREGGFVGVSDPATLDPATLDPTTSDPALSDLAGPRFDDTDDQFPPSIPSDPRASADSEAEDSPSTVAARDANDPWPMGGDVEGGLTSPDELFRMMQGEDSGSQRPNRGLAPETDRDSVSDRDSDGSAGGDGRGTLSDIDRETVADDSVSTARDASDASTAVAGFPKSHTIVDNDTLWDIAELYYGKPLLFKEIIAANPGMTESSALFVGKKITIPAPSNGVATARPVKASASPRSGAVAASGTYTVVKGDSLYKIAERTLGKGYRWTEIASNNPNIDPDNLKIGAVLKLPSR